MPGRQKVASENEEAVIRAFIHVRCCAAGRKYFCDSDIMAATDATVAVSAECCYKF